MNIIILTPSPDLYFPDELKSKLQSLGNIIFIKDIKPLSDVSELYTDEPKIVAIDPDFCDRKVGAEVIENMKNVQAICLQTTSFSWIDTAAAKNKNIPVVNLRGFSTYAVAEWSVMVAMNVARKIPLVIKDDRKQDFVKHQGRELKWSKAAIIGLGTIGTRIAELCAGLDMEVIYWSNNSRNDRFKYMDLSELMKEADFIFPTVAQNSDTKNLITDDMLNSMKPTTIFSSIVHNVFNHDLILKLVKEGKLYWYAFETEKEKFSDFEGNVWAGPALAWCTSESVQRNAIQRTDAIVKAVNNEYPTQVNK